MDVGRSEYFYNATTSSLSGSWPRVVFSRGEQPIGALPLYFTINADLGQVINETHYGDAIKEYNLWRGNVSPALRFPFTKWPFLTINSSLAWRYSWFSEQYDAAGQLASVPISRSYFNMSARITGPVFNRVWDRPNSRYAEKIKHSVEPWVYLQRITAFENYKLLPKSDYSDYVIGQTTKVSYGLNNRIYAKMSQESGKTQSTQIIGVAIQQSYYTDASAGTYDFDYSLVYGRAKVSKFTPALLTVEVTPTKAIGGSFRSEYDVSGYQWRSLGASGTAKVGEWLSTSGGWNLRRYNVGVSVGSQLSNHYLNSDTSVRLGQTAGNRVFNTFKTGFAETLRVSNADVAALLPVQTFFAGVYYPGYRPPACRSAVQYLDYAGRPWHVLELSRLLRDRSGIPLMVDVLVTGGAGFIGSHFVRYGLGTHPDWRVTTLDKLTYCGRLENLQEVMDNPRHRFVRGDIGDAAVAASCGSDVVCRRNPWIDRFRAPIPAHRHCRHLRPVGRRDARRLRQFIQNRPTGWRQRADRRSKGS